MKDKMRKIDELFFKLEAENCISCKSEHLKIIEKHEFPSKITRAIKCLDCGHKHTTIWLDKILENFSTK